MIFSVFTICIYLSIFQANQASPNTDSPTTKVIELEISNDVFEPPTTKAMELEISNDAFEPQTTKAMELEISNDGVPDEVENNQPNKTANSDSLVAAGVWLDFNSPTIGKSNLLFKN